MTLKDNQVEVLILAEEDAGFPSYASALAAGADVKAFIKEKIVLNPGCSSLIPTGLKMAIPPGYEIQVRPRSGLALKHQVTVLNTPGTIDADYRGELGIILINHGKEPFVIEPGMRIAQIVLTKMEQAKFVKAQSLSETIRGSNGFGHTGLN